MKLKSFSNFNESLQTESASWDFADEMNPNEQENVMKDKYASKLIESVTGESNETDGDFEIKLTNGDNIKYLYVYHPYKGDPNKQYLKVNGVRLDIDNFLENYAADYNSMILGAIYMYIDFKLGILK